MTAALEPPLAISDRVALSMPELARKLGISRSYAYQLARERRIPTFKVGGRVLIRVDEAERLLGPAPADTPTPAEFEPSISFS